MKVFISWSGTRSQTVAEALREWLPNVIQALQPWMSYSDIDKGTRWSTDVAAHLEDASVGIICLTLDNLDAPWILFEAGALSKTINRTFVCPYLLDVEPTDLKGPLVQFQATKAEKEDTRRLVHTINQAQGDVALSEIKLDKAFDLWWPQLEKHLQRVPKTENKEEQERPEKEMIIEILELARSQARGDITPPWLPALLSNRANNTLERLKQKYNSIAFREAKSVIEFSEAEAAAVKNNLMKKVQHSVYAIYRVETFLPLPLDTQDNLNYFQANTAALKRIGANHPDDSQEHTIHRIFVVSEDILENLDLKQRLKSAIKSHSEAGFDVRIVLQEELEEPLYYEFAIYDEEVALRISINSVEQSYGSAAVYIDTAIVNDVYMRKYREIEVKSYGPKEFWLKYSITPQS